MKKNKTKGNRCPKCSGKLKNGIALENVATGIGDFHDAGTVVTVSYGKIAKIIPVVKCVRCGMSFYK